MTRMPSVLKLKVYFNSEIMYLPLPRLKNENSGIEIVNTMESTDIILRHR